MDSSKNRLDWKAYEHADEETIVRATLEALRKQGQPSGNTYDCFYRSGENDEYACAAGLWIPDEYYTTEMESQSATSIIYEGYLRGSSEFMEWYHENIKVLRDLQAVHDNKLASIYDDDELGSDEVAQHNAFVTAIDEMLVDPMATIMKVRESYDYA